MQLNCIEKETFYTPEELAERLKVSVATVYKLINQDVLPYFRVGKCYRIPASALQAYMMSEGNLPRFIKAAPVIPEAARRFVELVDAAPDEFQKRILGIVLFGSYARGSFDEKSDIDLLVLVDKSDALIEQKIAGISSEAMAAAGYEEFLSPIRMSVEHWNESAANGSPLYEEIQREGIVLWPKGSKSLKDIEKGR